MGIMWIWGIEFYVWCAQRCQIILTNKSWHFNTEGNLRFIDRKSHNNISKEFEKHKKVDNKIIKLGKKQHEKEICSIYIYNLISRNSLKVIVFSLITGSGPMWSDFIYFIYFIYFLVNWHWQLTALILLNNTFTIKIFSCTSFSGCCTE